MFSIVVFLCGIITVMLFFFLAYHTYLVYQGHTTNETVKRNSVLTFIEQKLTFMRKWEKARAEKKAFKPAKKSIDKYEVGGDIAGELTDEQVTAIRDKVEKQHDLVKKGSYFRPISMRSALAQIWDPDTYDINGNPEDVIMERRGEALQRFD